eukprot:GHVT01076218.1.p3 GENE.GHVT01076218.1~~GHVT01076218.1.p3  ORF type:complete len:106 (-),score=18.19 GHVT01076218.1:178-495(-)
MEKVKERVINFGAGPSCLPLEVLQNIQNDFLNFNGSGMGVLEMSHRGKEFQHIFISAKNNLRSLLNLRKDYNILFMQGGASLQFSCVPLNLLPSPDAQGAYAVTG